MKKLLFKFFFIFFVLLIFNTNISFSKDNNIDNTISSKILVYDNRTLNLLNKAMDKSTGYEESQKIFLQVIENLKNKKHHTKEDVTSIADLYILMGDNAKNIINFNGAIVSYKMAYETLKRNKMHKENELSVYCLLNITYYYGIFNNQETCGKYIKELEKTQVKMAEKYSDIYNVILDYYKYKNNKRKIQYYEEKIKNFNKN